MRIAITQAHVVVGASETIDDGVVVLDGNRIETSRPTKARLAAATI